ncbi:MAG: zinc ribbon domain-containing protein [Saprospiraceae bacterium]|nr:zinc ribbon domain-containing protein [Saprospiraceae bacterium]
MIFCPKCHTQLVDNAKFCHHCGANIDIPLAECPSCTKKNPADARFCYGCGSPMSPIVLSKHVVQNSKYNFQDLTALEEQTKSLFFEELKRLSSWIAPEKVDDYLKAVLTKNFYTTVDRRSKQIAEEISELHFSQTTPSVFQLEKQLNSAVSSLALYHIVYNCRDISPMVLSEKIMKYEKATRGHVDLKQMVFDYLDLANEKERIYTDFVKMPFNTLQNAAKSFVFAAKDEFIYLISDSTFLGSGKEGFAMTEFGLYWKAPLEKPQKIYFHQIARLEKHKTWLKVNNRFFNVNANLNIKMLFLLEKLKNIYSDA